MAWILFSRQREIPRDKCVASEAFQRDGQLTFSSEYAGKGFGVSHGVVYGIVIVRCDSKAFPF